MSRQFSAILPLFALILVIPGPAFAQCLADGSTLISPQLDFDAAFTDLDDALLNDFPEWQTRYNQINTADPSPQFSDEDNSQSGIEDDDHLDLLAAIINGEPVGTVLGGLNAVEVADIRESFLNNRAKIRDDLTFTVLFIVTVSILDEIEAGDIGFSNVLQDLVAAYMTIGDQESVAFIRGFLVTLSEIFIEQGVASGDIPAFVEGATKDAMRSAVNGNFVASRYESYGDAPGATKPNILGNTGNVNGLGNINATEYALQGNDRQAWMIAKGILLPPLEIVTGPPDLDLMSGETLELSVTVAGGDGSAVDYDWKRFDAGGPTFTQVSTESVFTREYALPSDAGQYAAAICDDTWARVSGLGTVTVTPQAFQIVEEPVDVFSLLLESQEFSVRVVGGTALPAYQWYFGTTAGNLAPIPGATSRVLTIPLVDFSDVGFYRVEIAGEDNGTVTLQSQLAELKLPESMPSITIFGPNPASAECGMEYIDAGAVANDDVDGDITDQIVVESDVDTDTPGEYTVTYSVTGPTGSAELTRTVIVADMTAPDITLNGATVVTVECGEAYTEAGASATDLCDGVLTGNLITEGEVDTTIPGTYFVNYSVVDQAGNVGTASRQVDVVDTTSPVLTLSGATTITMECGTVFADPGATASDDCASDLTGAITISGAVDTATPGSYTLNYSVADPAGNTAQRSRTVIVEDTTAPVLTVLGQNPFNIEAGDTFNDPGVTAVDSCAGDLADMVEVSGSVDAETIGSYTLTYSVSDGSGNSAAVSRTVQVVDTDSPIIVLVGPNPQIVECGEVYTDLGATATDVADGDLSGSVIVTGGVDATTPGDYVVEYSVMDVAGNSASVMRTVRVEDTTPPDFFGLESPVEIERECTPSHFAFPPMIPDACDGEVQSTREQLPNDDTPDPSDFILRYTATDSAGNEAVFIEVYTIVDTVAPGLALLGGETVVVECGTPYVEPGVEAQDACDGDLTAQVIATDNIDTATPGAYQVTYTVTDEAGNSRTINRNVNVVDTTPPVITFDVEGDVVLECGVPLDGLGVTALDVCDGDLTTEIVVTDPPDPFVYDGTFTTFTVTDSAGNTSERSRFYSIVDTTPPVITLNGDERIVLSCGEAYVEPGATAVDSCWPPESFGIDILGEVDSETPGEYIIVYEVYFAGPVARVERVVEVLNNCELVIESQPSSARIYTGTDYEFRIIASGGVGPLSYTWFRDGEELATTSAPEFEITNAALDDAGDYTCTISDGESSVGTQVATLEVFVPATEGFHSADPSQDWSISLTELLRVIQFFNSGGYGCLSGSEDGFAAGPGAEDCTPHDSDYNPQDWEIALTELLRIIQFFNSANGAYHAEEGTEDGFAPAAG